MSSGKGKQEFFILNSIAAHILGRFYDLSADCHESSHEQWNKTTPICPVSMASWDFFSAMEMSQVQGKQSAAVHLLTNICTMVFFYKHTQEARS